MDTQTINLYQQAIDSLVKGGFDVLKVVESDGHALYFIVYKWQEAYFNSAQSVEFNTVEGINITAFLNKNLNLAQNYTQFVGALDNEIEKMDMVRVQFSKNAEWYKWSVPEYENRNKTVKR